MKHYQVIALLAFLTTLCSASAQINDCVTRHACMTASAAKAMNQTNTPSDTDIIRHERFRYQIDTPADPSGEIVVLLHGSGGDENTLFPFARPLWPHAVLIGIRGRLVQNGETRWYRKITPIRFDQNDINRESSAFVDFLKTLANKHHYDLTRTTFVGYSNGANLLAVVMMTHPDLVQRSILMRSMPVLDPMPGGNLQNSRVLTISGKGDRLYSPYAPALSSLLRDRGAKVESHMIAANHMIGKQDAALIKRWLHADGNKTFAAIPGRKPGGN